jgi:hypothetical protein
MECGVYTCWSSFFFFSFFSSFFFFFSALFFLASWATASGTDSLPWLSFCE